MRTKAVQFMKEKGWLEVTKKNTIWTNGAILVLHNPEDMSIGKDEYGCNKYLKLGKYKYKDKTFLPITKEDYFPDIDKTVKSLKEENYLKAQIKKEFGYLKLLKLSDKKEQFAIELTGGSEKIFIDYEYYSYLINDRHIWQVDEWKIKAKDNSVLAYREGVLLALIMPMDLRIENKKKGI